MINNFRSKKLGVKKKIQAVKEIQEYKIISSGEKNIGGVKRMSSS